MLPLTWLVFQSSVLPVTPLLPLVTIHGWVLSAAQAVC